MTRKQASLISINMGSPNTRPRKYCSILGKIDPGIEVPVLQSAKREQGGIFASFTFQTLNRIVFS